MDEFFERTFAKRDHKILSGCRGAERCQCFFFPGEVHAIVGENGAGKSTLIKVISGAITPDAGCIVLDGQEYTGLNPRLALEKGISVVYQELIQFDALTVADNIFLGTLDHQKNWQIDDRALQKKPQNY